MAISAEVNVSGTITGGIFGSTPIPTFSTSLSSSVGQGPIYQTLASGFNTITPPAGTQQVWMQLPTNANSVILKGVSGDTGIYLQPSGTWMQLPILTSSSSTFGLTCGGSIANVGFLYL